MLTLGNEKKVPDDVSGIIGFESHSYPIGYLY